MPTARRPLQPTASTLHFFGAELRHWRDLRHLSQEQLAIGVLHSKDLICKIEKADRRPNRDLARRLDEFLDTGGALGRLHELVEAQAGGTRAIRADGGRSIAICGSRAAGTDPAVIDEAVRALARLVVAMDLDVRHGPVGIGIEVVTYAADHYRCDGVESIVAVLGRPNVVRDVDAVVVVGGGTGTRDEIDLAVAAGIPVIPLASTGGAARDAYPRVGSRFGIRDGTALVRCADADAIADLVGRLLIRCRGERPTDRPRTVVTCSMSVDGRIDDAIGARLPNLGEVDAGEPDESESPVDAVLVGSSSAPVAHGGLTVILTRTGDLDAAAPIFDGPRPPIVYAPTGIVDRVRDRLGGTAVVVDASEPLSLSTMLADLMSRGVRRLVVTGDAVTRTRFLNEDLVDEVHLVVSPYPVHPTPRRDHTADATQRRFTGDTNHPFAATGRMKLSGIEYLGERVLLRYGIANAETAKGPAATGTASSGPRFCPLE